MTFAKTRPGGHRLISPLTPSQKVTDGLRGRFAQAAALLEDAAEDILGYRHLPLEHQRQLHSTNPLERLNKEIKRRSNVVGIFPTPQSVIRLPDDFGSRLALSHECIVRMWRGPKHLHAAGSRHSFGDRRDI